MGCARQFIGERCNRLAVTLAHEGVGEWLAVRESTGRVIDGLNFEASGHSGFRQRGFYFSPVPEPKPLTPDSRYDDYLTAASNHFREFVDAIQTGGTTMSNIADVGGLRGRGKTTSCFESCRCLNSLRSSLLCGEKCVFFYRRGAMSAEGRSGKTRRHFFRPPNERIVAARQPRSVGRSEDQMECDLALRE